MSAAIPVRSLTDEEIATINKAVKEDNLLPDFTFIAHDPDTTWLICKSAKSKEYTIIMDGEPQVACRSLTVAMNWILARIY